MSSTPEAENGPGASGGGAAAAGVGVDQECAPPTPPPPGVEWMFDGGTQAFNEIAIDSDYLWYDAGERILRADKKLCAMPQRVGDAESGAAERFVVEETRLYWLSKDRIYSQAKDGSDTREIPLPASFAFGSIAAHGDDLLVMDASASGLWRVPKTGGDVQQVATIRTAGDAGSAARMLVDGDTAYVSYIGNVWKVDLRDGSVTGLFQGRGGGGLAIALVNGVFHWLDGAVRGDSTLYRWADDEAQPLATTDQWPFLPTNMVYDASRRRLYLFASIGRTTLLSFDLQTQQFAAVLPERVRSAGWLVQDETYLYWAQLDSDDPAIMRLAKSD